MQKLMSNELELFSSPGEIWHQPGGQKDSAASFNTGSGVIRQAPVQRDRALHTQLRLSARSEHSTHRPLSVQPTGLHIELQLQSVCGVSRALRRTLKTRLRGCIFHTNKECRNDWKRNVYSQNPTALLFLLLFISLQTFGCVFTFILWGNSRWYV